MTGAYEDALQTLRHGVREHAGGDVPGFRPAFPALYRSGV
jgi:hypothetical protein